MKFLKVIEWSGSIFGILGAFMLALNNEYSGWGFVMFLLSNVFWITYGIKTKMYSMLSMQAIFTMSSILGVINWLT